jgi:hypothetical protein
MKTNIHFSPYLAQFFLEWKMLQTKFVEKIKTHILCSVTFFFENRAIYEKMWKNILDPDRPQMTISSMRFACWIPEAMDRHSEYVILIVFPLQQQLHERVSALRYTYSACIVISWSVRRTEWNFISDWNLNFRCPFTKTVLTFLVTYTLWSLWNLQVLHPRCVLFNDGGWVRQNTTVVGSYFY